MWNAGIYCVCEMLVFTEECWYLLRVWNAGKYCECEMLVFVEKCWYLMRVWNAGNCCVCEMLVFTAYFHILLVFTEECWYLPRVWSYCSFFHLLAEHEPKGWCLQSWACLLPREPRCVLSVNASVCLCVNLIQQQSWLLTLQEGNFIESDASGMAHAGSHREI